jgi:hypothetical protein
VTRPMLRTGRSASMWPPAGTGRKVREVVCQRCGYRFIGHPGDVAGPIVRLLEHFEDKHGGVPKRRRVGR